MNKENKNIVKKDEEKKNKEGDGGILKNIFMIFIIALFGFFVGAIGTSIHRGGVDSFPYGIIISLLLVFISAYIVRAATSKRYSLIFTFILISTVLFFATSGTNHDVMVLGASLPGSSQLSGSIGYIWLFGSTLLTAICNFLPDEIFMRKVKK